MKIFERKPEESYTIIIGCGRLGANLANTLSNEGENVLIMDENKNSFRRLASNFGGLSALQEKIRRQKNRIASCRSRKKGLF